MIDLINGEGLTYLLDDEGNLWQTFTLEKALECGKILLISLN